MLTRFYTYLRRKISELTEYEYCELASALTSSSPLTETSAKVSVSTRPFFFLRGRFLPNSRTITLRLLNSRTISFITIACRRSTVRRSSFDEIQPAVDSVLIPRRTSILRTQKNNPHPSHKNQCHSKPPTHVSNIKCSLLSSTSQFTTTHRLMFHFKP